MNILHFHPDGRMASCFIDPLIEAERCHGHDSVLITSTRKSRISSETLPYDISLRNLIKLPWAFLRICMLIKARRPDMVIAHNMKSSPLPLLAAMIMGIRMRIYFNHGVPFVGYTGMMRLFLRLFEKFNCAVSNRVVTVSPDMVELLRGVQRNIQPTIILNGSPCGLDLDNYNRDLYKDSTWRETHKIKEDDVVVVFIGRPEKRKGFEYALKLWTEYMTGSKYKLIICGANSVDVLKYLPSVAENIICLGFVNNIPEILSNADILIQPSLHEGLSYAVLEAMASNCVVIANDIEGVRNLINNGVNGYLIKDNLLQDYANLIQSLAGDRSRVVEITSEAVKTANMFSRKDFLPAYLSFLEKASKQS